MGIATTDLKEGDPVTVSFETKATQNRELTVAAQQTELSWAGTGLGSSLQPLGTEYHTYPFDSTAENVTGAK